MSERDELAELIRDSHLNPKAGESAWNSQRTADRILAAGYRKPRTISTAEELAGLACGTVIQTSKESDTLLRKVKGASFRDQSGYELSATTLWRDAVHPITVLYEPTP